MMMTKLHQTARQRRLPRVSRPMICANKFNMRNYLEAMRRKTGQTQTKECKSEQGICRTPKQLLSRWRGRRSATSTYTIKAQGSKNEELQNVCEDAAKVIWCYDVW